MANNVRSSWMVIKPINLHRLQRAMLNNIATKLVFHVQTNWALPTDFIIDNIQLTPTCVEN